MSKSVGEQIFEIHGITTPSVSEELLHKQASTSLAAYSLIDIACITS